jgi:hypothetical protein
MKRFSMTVPQSKHKTMIRLMKDSWQSKPKKRNMETQDISSGRRKALENIRKRLEAQVPADLRSQTGKLISHLLNVLITTTAQVKNNVLTLLHSLGDLHNTPDSV